MEKVNVQPTTEGNPPAVTSWDFDSQVMPYRGLPLQHGVPDDAQLRGRRGPRPGDVLQGVQVLRQVRRGHEPEGVALQDPQEHVHQQLPEEEARAPERRFRRNRGLLRADRPARHSEPPADPEAEFFSGVLDDDVQKALESLPYDYRMVVILADLEDFSYKEIAEILDCPVGTVMSRLYRGRKLLEKALLQVRPASTGTSAGPSRRRCGPAPSRPRRRPLFGRRGDLPPHGISGRSGPFLDNGP